MHRHLVLHDDFEVFVASSSPFCHPKIPSLQLHRRPLHVRLSNTRFCRFIRQFEMALGPLQVGPELLEAFLKFAPDAIFTIPDNTVIWIAY
jgi:hypothetical protein